MAIEGLRRKAERLAARLEKKHRGGRQFDIDLSAAADHLRDTREAGYNYARLTGRVAVKLVGGEIRVIVDEAPVFARARRRPPADCVGAPVVARTGGSVTGGNYGWADAPLGPVDQTLVSYYAGRIYRQVDASKHDEVTRLSADYRRMIVESTLADEVRGLLNDARERSSRVAAVAGRGGAGAEAGRASGGKIGAARAA